MNVTKYVMSVRELLDVSEERLWTIQRPGLIDITFDDGVTIKNADTVDVIISWYYWQIAVIYREVEIPSTLFLNGRILTHSLHLAMLKLAIVPTVNKPNIDKEDVWLVAYRDIYNKLYNAIVSRLISFVTSTDVPHILEILFDPDIYEANCKVTDSLHTVDRAYEVIRNVLNTKYPRNPIVRARRYHTVKEEQLLQSFGPRGRITDIDNYIYRRPIKRGFAMGFRTINDLCKESRSAAKALLFNKDPVAYAEYFSRKLQLVCNGIRQIVRGDCGATSLHTLLLPTGKLGNDMLKVLAGLYRRDLATGKLVLIDKDDTDLLGTTIEFRTTMTCMHLPNQCVCETCYGQTAYSIPWDSNPGHVSCTAVNKLITQLIISSKHLDFIEHMFEIMLSEDEKRYMYVKDGPSSDVYLTPNKKGQRIVMRVRSKDAFNLLLVNYQTNLQTDIPSNISELHLVDFYTLDKDGMFTLAEQYELTKHGVQPSLSLDLLKYIKKHDWETVGNYFQFDLSDWDWTKPIFSYPMKHDSMSEFADRVERFIRSCNAIKNEDDENSGSRSTKNKLHSLNKYKDPTEGLIDCYLLISEKLKGVHIGHIATILAASRAQDPASGNYKMPAGLNNGRFASHDSILAGRSYSVAMLYEKQADYFDVLDGYLIKDRHTSIMDDTIYIAPGKYDGVQY